MDNLKEKEQKLLESLVRLDTITDLVVGSKKKIVDLQEVKAKLETEKNDLSVKLSTLENENDGLKAELQELESSINSPDSLNENLKEKILKIEEENAELKQSILKFVQNLLDCSVRKNLHEYVHTRCFRFIGASTMRPS